MWSPLLALTSRTKDESAKISPGWPFASSEECCFIQIYMWHLDTDFTDFQKIFFWMPKISPMVAAFGIDFKDL